MGDFLRSKYVRCKTIWNRSITITPIIKSYFKNFELNFGEKPENKKPFVILALLFLFTCSFFTFAVTASSAKTLSGMADVLNSGPNTHPFLMFNNISDVYGAKHLSEYPWSVWSGGLKLRQMRD